MKKPIALILTACVLLFTQSCGATPPASAIFKDVSFEYNPSRQISVDEAFEIVLDRYPYSRVFIYRFEPTPDVDLSLGAGEVLKAYHNTFLAHYESLTNREDAETTVAGLPALETKGIIEPFEISLVPGILSGMAPASNMHAITIVAGGTAYVFTLNTTEEAAPNLPAYTQEFLAIVESVQVLFIRT